jgi:hypothetical protein
MMDEDGRRVTGKIMKDAARVVVGGGVAGCSVLYHLRSRSSWMKLG